MSRISLAYEAIKTRVEAQLTSHLQLTNPYDTDDNNEQVLKLGYGLAVGSAVNTNRKLCGKYSIDRDMSIIITRKYYANEQNVIAKETSHKNALEDLHLVIKDFESNPYLDLGSGQKANFRYISDNGINTIFVEKKNYFKIEVSFKLSYFESTT